jgi:hypothetical protein
MPMAQPLRDPADRPPWWRDRRVIPWLVQGVVGWCYWF